ncbi:MAG: hypothetical protein JSC188_000269 [Candidatus Tokpelaia sp. JSC188]|nr:MAG: hypothetical protein JSC188_000269 [Candidatus Tokpelaia sp. JSC188]
MVKTKFGIKRTDPETGKKFYDLNRDPIVSPYTGISYPRSYFESSVKADEEKKEAKDELEPTIEKSEFVSLDDVEESEKDDELPDLSDDDAFLPEEEGDDDVSGIIGGGINNDNE